MRTNYLAVIVCAALYWILGAVWYAVLFSKPWMALTGVQSDGGNQALPYIVTFLLDLLIAFVLAQLCMAQCQQRGPWSGDRNPALDRYRWANCLHQLHVRDALHAVVCDK
jgi:hypothetical protein